MTDHVELRRGAYHDSVSLMQVTRRVADSAAVEAVQVAMATEVNVDLIRGMGFTVPEAAGPNDLVVAVRVTDESGIRSALAAVEEALDGLATAGPPTGLGEQPAAHTLGGAVRTSGATLAMVSVPGEFAAVEALDAIRAGASVMLYSDNVPVADEVRLKDEAEDAGVLVMGPDCGTAVVGGVALGFANAVRPGPVGIVAASGTGAQQVMCLLDAAGVGVSHCLGVGGRDLTSEVGGRSARRAMAALDADDATTSVLIVSKPPAAEVLARLEDEAGRLTTPVHWATLGPGRPDLTRAVEAALEATGHEVPTWPTWGAPGHAGRPGTGRSLRGLYCGGTLADEAMLVAGEALGGIRSNIPLEPDLALGPDLRAEGHLVIDFGDDALTVGRPHPMIDPTLRLGRIAAEAADPTCGVLLLDLVLGHGSHPDPATGLAEAVAAARRTAAADGRDLPVVVALVGVEADPQGLTRSAERLADAGAAVFLSHAAAVRHAVSVVDRPPAPTQEAP